MDPLDLLKRREALDLEERLANLISDHIVPRLVPELEIIPWRRSHVVAIQVHASPVRPHYLRREGLDGGMHLRVGSTNRRADRELIEELRRFARGEAYDEQPMPKLDSEALDFRAASESFAPVRRLRRSDLQTLRLVTTIRVGMCRPLAACCFLARTARDTFRMPGSRLDDSMASTSAGSRTVRRSTRP